MRIGLFTDAYLPEITGVTTVVRTLRDELVRLGHEAYVYAPRYNQLSDDERNVYRFRSGPVFAYKTARMALPYNREAAKSFGDLDVVHSHTPFSLAYVALIAAHRHNLPHVPQPLPTLHPAPASAVGEGCGEVLGAPLQSMLRRDRPYKIDPR